jgi:cathepsin B
MKSILLIALMMASAMAFFNPVNEEMVEDLKLSATTWTPMEVAQNPLAKKDSFEVLALLGSKHFESNLDRVVVHQTNGNIPESFSTLEKWPECILPIQNQQFCGADWAFVAVEILSERLCISTNGTQKAMLSVNDILSCDEKDWGCSGGYPDRAWDFMTDEGVVTEECFSFDSKDGHKIQCQFQNECVNGKDVEYKKYYSTQYNSFSSEQSIQKELITNGPVQTEFQVYSDFLNYGNGIYQHTKGGKLGFYSAKIVGWGIDNDTPYWLAATVFGEEWGEKGYFRIIRGNNECNFESSTLAGNIDTYRL